LFLSVCFGFVVLQSFFIFRSFYLVFFEMLKPKECNFADSNIANLGSDLEKKCKAAAATKEHAWDNAGSEVGLLIWRIEKFHVVSWPKDKYGSFFSGDAYILLNTYKKPDGNALIHDIHFWLGKHCTQDESGTAAYKTVELDDRLGGGAVQHREVMGHESSLFMGYFKDHINIMEGGVGSGFRHTEPEKYDPRLLQMKGKKRVRMTQVEMKASNLNSSDVFVLDMGLQIYQFNGKKSSNLERMKVHQFCESLESERNGLAKLIIVEEDSIPDEFWKPLGGPAPIAECDPSPNAGEDPPVSGKTLWLVTDHSGAMDFKQIAQGHECKRSLLDSKEVYILDTGAEIYAWIGKNAPVEEKRHAIQYGNKYIEFHNKPPYLHLARVLDGGESPHFLGFLH